MRCLLILLLSCPALVGSQAQTLETPFEYVNFFDKEFIQLQDLQIKYSSLHAYKGESEAEQMRPAIVAQTERMLQRLQGVTPHPDDPGAQASALKTAGLLLAKGKKNYRAAGVQRAGCDDCFAALLEQVALIRKDEQAISEAMTTTIQHLEAFAADHNIRVTTENNERTLVLRRINRLNNYLQEVNLAVSEVQYANNAVTKVLNKRQKEQGQLAAKALVEASANAVQRLSALARIQDDAPFFAATRRLIDAYRKAGQYLYPSMFDAFEDDGSIPNDKVDSYNNSIEALNKNITALHQDLSNAQQVLEQQHVPVLKE